ncbi:MAG: DHH family phosphoesterase [Flavobacteriaceae bacterium]|nr:DHH family phosphoesterase [Flavobacteriaceae bacterium]
MEKDQLHKLKTFLATPRNIVIVPHRNPDGDAMGSTLALCEYFNNTNHTATVVAPNEYPEFLRWLPGSKNVILFDRQNKQAKRAINNSDIIFLLDFNALHRVGDDMANTLEVYENDFAMIDHHQQPDAVAAYLYSDTSICSTAQMVYHFLEMLQNTDAITKSMATCLYTGIMTDTGSFRFRSTTSTTHRIVADLIEKGAENDKIHGHVYDANSYNRLLLLGQALTNLKALPTYKTAFITLSEEEKKRFEYKKGDTEGVVNYALSLKDIVFAAIFIEDVEQKIIKISFRSKGSFSVNLFARNYFDGGGHINAAGGKSTKSLEETVAYFKSLLPRYKEALEKSYEE